MITKKEKIEIAERLDRKGLRLQEDIEKSTSEFW